MNPLNRKRISSLNIFFLLWGIFLLMAKSDMTWVCFGLTAIGLIVLAVDAKMNKGKFYFRYDDDLEE